jgi:hypothetical protein
MLIEVRAIGARRGICGKLRSFSEVHRLDVLQGEGADLLHRAHPLERLAGLVLGDGPLRVLEGVSLEEREEVVGSDGGTKQLPSPTAETLASGGIVVKGQTGLVVIGDVVMDHHVRHATLPDHQRVAFRRVQYATRIAGRKRAGVRQTVSKSRAEGVRVAGREWRSHRRATRNTLRLTIRVELLRYIAL